VSEALITLHQIWAALVSFLRFDPGLLATPEMVFRIALQGLLLFGSAFFSGSETALFSLSRLDFQQLRRERNPRSETLHALLDQPRRLIISILCGNELVNIAAAANMTGILMVLYGPEKAGGLAVILMVALLLLFGEVTPKTIAVSNPVRVSTNVVALPINAWVKLITPLRWAIRLVADRITSMIVGEEKGAENILRVDEFRSLVEEVAKGGELDATERALIHHLLDANDTEIVEIMIPRTRTRFLDADTPVPELIEQFKGFRHSRVPVCRHHRDNLVGFLHAEVVLRLILDNVDLSTVSLHDIMHDPVVVPLTKKVDEMFDFFQDRNVRAAVCLNEFGGVEGFITITDVLNFIFGHVVGTVHGSELYHERDENLYEVPGEMKLTDFNNLTHFGLDDPRMTTIGGVAFRHLDRLPREGDSVVVEGVTITILEMDGHRIAKVRVSVGEPEESEGSEAGSDTSADLLPGEEAPRTDNPEGGQSSSQERT
jgi:CBS domain containing-hemolysin-like protein